MASFRIILFCEYWFVPKRFRPSLDQFRKVFRINCIPLYFCTFVMDKYSIRIRLYVQ